MRTLIATAVACAGVALTPAPAADADVYDDFYAALNWLTGKYGVVVYVSQAPLDPGTYASITGRTITLNSAWVNNPDAFYGHVADDTAAGFHRAANCAPAAQIAAHEYGHALDYVTDFSAHRELAAALRSGFGGIVSEYGTVSADEAIAESFAAVECDTPTPAEQAIYTMLVN